MARKIRIEYAGAAYHVMARGNQGRDIYADDRDRKLTRAAPSTCGRPKSNFLSLTMSGIALPPVCDSK